MATRFGFIPVRPAFLLSEEVFNRIVGDYILALEQLGGERWSDEMLANPAPVFYLIATGGTEGKLLELRAKRNKTAPDEPVFLVAHPANNSLPASLEVLARLQQDGEEGRIFYLKGPDDEGGLRQIEAAMHDLKVSRVLKQARIGLVGEPSDWLVASSPDPATVQEQWGPEVVSIAMDELSQAIQAVSPEVIAPILTPLVADATEVREPSQVEMEDIVRVYVALKRLVERHRLDAITVRCFDLVLQWKTTGCFGLAQLTDEGIIAGCEGDLVSAVGLLWAYKLLGQIPWMANPAQLDEARNTLWLAHCTVPRRIVRDYRLRSHFESGLGLALIKNGPDTAI